MRITLRFGIAQPVRLGWYRNQTRCSYKTVEQFLPRVGIWDS